MSELTPLSHHNEVSTIEFEPDLTDGEKVAVVCMYVLEEKITAMEDADRERSVILGKNLLQLPPSS